MKEKLKKLFGGIDATVGCYMIAGALLLIGILEAVTGHYLRAFNTFLYTFIVFCCSQLIHQNKHLKRQIVLQHLIIEVLEEKSDIKHEEKENEPQPQMPEVLSPNGIPVGRADEKADGVAAAE